MKTVKINIENLKYNGCASTIKKGLQKFNEMQILILKILLSASVLTEEIKVLINLKRNYHFWVTQKQVIIIQFLL